MSLRVQYQCGVAVIIHLCPHIHSPQSGSGEQMAKENPADHSCTSCSAHSLFISEVKDLGLACLFFALEVHAVPDGGNIEHVARSLSPLSWPCGPMLSYKNTCFMDSFWSHLFYLLT